MKNEKLKKAKHLPGVCRLDKIWESEENLEKKKKKKKKKEKNEKRKIDKSTAPARRVPAWQILRIWRESWKKKKKKKKKKNE